MNTESIHCVKCCNDLNESLKAMNEIQQINRRGYNYFADYNN